MKFKPSSLICFPLVGTVALVLMLGSFSSCKKQPKKEMYDRNMSPSPGATSPVQPSKPAARKFRSPTKVEGTQKRGLNKRNIDDMIRKQMRRTSKKGSVSSYDPKEAILKSRETLEKVEKKLQRLSPSGTSIRQNNPKAREVCSLAKGICRIAKHICKITTTNALSPNDCRETKAACRRAGSKCPASLRKSFEIDM